MKTPRPDSAFFGSFSPAFRMHAHQLLAWGYQDAVQRIRVEDDEEPSITGFIASAIEERFRAWDCPSWFRSIDALDERPQDMKGTAGKSRPRTDLVVRGTGRGRPEYVFEAKRLSRGRREASEYVGSKGMGCFVSGYRASRYNEAGMLGYVQSDSLMYWRSEVCRKVNEIRDVLELTCDQWDVSVMSSFPVEWVSEHGRASVGRRIRVYHILLDCGRQSIPVT